MRLIIGLLLLSFGAFLIFQAWRNGPIRRKNSNEILRKANLHKGDTTDERFTLYFFGVYVKILGIKELGNLPTELDAYLVSIDNLTIQPIADYHV